MIDICFERARQITDLVVSLSFSLSLLLCLLLSQGVKPDLAAAHMQHPLLQRNCLSY